MVFIFLKTYIKSDFGKVKRASVKNQHGNKNVKVFFNTSCKIKCFQRFTVVGLAK
jgi:hypothetical protein